MAERPDRTQPCKERTWKRAVVFSGHFLRMPAARWIGLDTPTASAFMLSTASFSALGYEHSPEPPVIRLWNDVHHSDTPDGRVSAEMGN